MDDGMEVTRVQEDLAELDVLVSAQASEVQHVSWDAGHEKQQATVLHQHCAHGLSKWNSEVLDMIFSGLNGSSVMPMYAAVRSMMD